MADSVPDRAGAEPPDPPGDGELLQQFQEVERLSEDDKHVIKTLLDAFLTKRQLQVLAC
ncbi:MAG: hypothetical protein P9F75_18990 [Candidatus Contendobacter sp.]|nr:hypothetical protein [Candidatus Contendobacter sp.]